MSRFQRTQSEGKSSSFDFIVVGYGTAGKSAVKTIKTICPTARVAVIDPLRRPEPALGVYYIKSRVAGLSTRDRKIELDNDTTLRYGSSVLIASGSHGAPPPYYLIDERLLDRIWEIRPTVVPNKLQRAVLPREDVHDKVWRSAVHEKASLAILGSGWEALDIACHVALLSRKSRTRHTLLFGRQGPLCDLLPTYLSSAVMKKLRAKRIDVLDRSLVRYLSYQAPKGDREGPAVQLFSAKSYDFLDGSTRIADYVVVAPDTSAFRGSATLSTDDIPEFLCESSKGRSWYKSWSQMVGSDFDEPSPLACFRGDGRIMVNAEMQACSGVYGAGSVARWANAVDGNSVVAGSSPHESQQSGHVAATNMVRDFRSSSPASMFQGTTARQQQDSLSMNAIRILRSDQLPWRNQSGSSALADVGIHALCVGHCSSEGLSTHAVWWTNQSAQRRMAKLGDASGRKGTQKPVYGVGVVFYLDAGGRIYGVLLWGLPYADSKGKLHQALIGQLRNILRTNGGLRSLENEVDQARMFQYLERESKRIVATCFGGQVEDIPRPLHRYSEPRPANIRIASMARKEGSQSVNLLGENMFMRYEDDELDDPKVPYPRHMANGEKATAMHEWSIWEQREGRWEENEKRSRPVKEEPLWVRKGDETRNTTLKERVNAAYNRHLNRD